MLDKQRDILERAAESEITEEIDITTLPTPVLDIIKHVSRMGCMCQTNAIDVERNSHWPSCIVGNAQKLLGQKVHNIMEDKQC